LILFSLYAQDSVVIVINLTDKHYSKDPVRNAKATLHYRSATLKRTTNNRGKTFYTTPKGIGFDISFKHDRYFAAKYHKRIPANLKKDTIEYHFTMELIRSQLIQEVIVAAPGVPIVEYSSKQHHVSDFEILNNGNLLLLTYPKRLKKESELIVWDGKNVINRFKVHEIAEKLVHDYRGNPHVVCEESVFGIHVSDKKIEISGLEKSYFYKYLAPILDTNETKMYFSNFNKDYPAFDYFAYDQLDSTYTKILEIEDELMMELYRSEYKWVDVRTKLWAENKEIETGIDAEIWVGANYFTQSIYYKELYAPLFHRNDTLFIFDYYKDRLRTFDHHGNRLDSIPIYHHYDKRNSGWESNLIQDRATGQIYGIYDRAGYKYLGWVDTKNGSISKQVKLEYRYAQNIAVHNNTVYFIYRPFETPQKKYLYKERLPYDFGFGTTPEGDDLTKGN
jgi:hypothetical protein